ncbi:MAG: hypothetical protein AAGK14_15350 [Verrucomicrobiota bacterium]
MKPNASSSRKPLKAQPKPKQKALFLTERLFFEPPPEVQDRRRWPVSRYVE